MIELRIRGPGQEGFRVFAQIEELTEIYREALFDAWHDSGLDLVREARRQVREEPKTGRVYRVSIGGRVRHHQASAPGESHANLTGRLESSISYTVTGWPMMEFGYGADNLRDAPEYARPVELGSSRMDPRPTLENAIRASDRDIVRNFVSAFEKRRAA